MLDWIVTKEAFAIVRKFERRFDCKIRIDEPSDRLVLDVQDETFNISSIDNIAILKKQLTDSIETGINIPLENCKHQRIVYDDTLQI